MAGIRNCRFEAALVATVSAIGVAMCSWQAHSASIDAAASYIVFPIVVQSASYTSEITIFNPNATSASLEVDYVGGDGTPATGGPRTCAPLTIAANGSVQFNFGAQCSLATGSHFGILRVHEWTAATTSPTPVHGYSRVSNPQGIGFSVPALPLNVFEASAAEVVGLKRQAGYPGYQTNCFVGANLEGSTYSIRLRSAAGDYIGSTLSGVLAANQLKRFIDIFAAVGAPAGDYQNVRAYFTGNYDTKGPGLMAFCTVQENAAFGADFRIAGTPRPFDKTRAWESKVYGSFAAYGNKHVYQMGFRTPDWLRCYLESAQPANLEMIIVGFNSTGNQVVVAGGQGVKDTARVWFSPRSAYPSVPWRVEVGTELIPTPTWPIYYTLTCQTGSGHAALAGPAVETDNF